MSRMVKGRLGTVGKSHRTPFKHFLLNALLGREAGIFALCPRKTHAKADPWHIIDMNAGDASCDSGMSSPAVISKHAEFARARGVPAKVTLIERAETTFQRLVNNVPAQPGVECLHADSRLFRVNPTHKYQAVFVHSDPNSLGDWCLTPEVIEAFSETTTMLATLGCNVGGLKRLPAAERAGWFTHVRRVTDSMPRYHDAVLIALDSDPSQWAYLVRAPLRWTIAIMREAERGAQRCSLRLSMASLVLQSEDFHRLERDLFLTTSERAATNG